MEFALNVSQLQVLPDGSLESGYYTYRVAAMLPSGEVDLANALKVHAKYQWNTIGIYWDDVPGADAYRVYRRGSDEREGSILVSPPAFFHDNGLIEFE